MVTRDPVIWSHSHHLPYAHDEHGNEDGGSVVVVVMVVMVAEVMMFGVVDDRRMRRQLRKHMTMLMLMPILGEQYAVECDGTWMVNCRCRCRWCCNTAVGPRFQRIWPVRMGSHRSCLFYCCCCSY